MHRTLRHAMLLPLALAIAACTVGPDYVRPAPEVPARFAAAADAPGVAPTPAPDAPFWQRFDDPLLSDLVEQALAANPDLRIALANHDRAEALLGSAKLDRFPTVTAAANASSTRASANQAPGASRAERDNDDYGAAIHVGWEIDLFGRIRREVEAGRAEESASAADLAAAQVAIAGEVARTYLDLRGTQERLRVARANAGNQRDTLALVAARLEAGGASDFDRARASAQLEATEARVPALEAAVAVDEHRVAVLLGQPPDALAQRLDTVRALPALPGAIDPGTPGSLLRRRPDVAAAEARLHAATARIGVATADLFPRFTLGGLLGSDAGAVGDLFEGDSETRQGFLGIDWSFLDVGRVRARIAASDAAADAALATYRKTVLQALEETANALVRYARARSEDAHLAQAAADAAHAAELAHLRFEAGATGLLDVLDAERTRLDAEDALATARTVSVGDAVSLYLAVAGGWPDRMPTRASLAGH
jgi:NodT family efflux transporter outer membrane factor (OMF) lipoprotein